MMETLTDGLLYCDELNKIIYSNDFIINSGLNLDDVSDLLGEYAEYISNDEKDSLYARSKGIKLFNEDVSTLNYSLSGFVDVEKEIELLKEKNPEFAEVIQSEYELVCQNEHNILLLKISFLLKRHLDKTSNGVYLMRGSGVSSYIFYAIGLNRVNPYKFGLDYKDFWKT